MEWGDRHLTEGQAAPRALHRACGGALTQRCTCTACEAEIGVADVELRYDRAGSRAA
jgi:hypothetical protein